MIYGVGNQRSMNSTSEFSIDRFMENRWLDAKEILTELDSAFVHALEVQDSVKDKGLWLPYDLPSPPKRLPLEWHDLLESTVDIVQHIDRWAFMVKRLEAATDYIDTWTELGWALADKLGGLISRTCKVYSLGRLRDRYLKDIEKVKGNFGKTRTALVHGASNPSKGELGVNARAATEEEYWERMVVLGFPGMMPYLLFPQDNPPSPLVEVARPTTNNVLVRVGAILGGLEEEIQRFKNHK